MKEGMVLKWVYPVITAILSGGAVLAIQFFFVTMPAEQRAIEAAHKADARWWIDQLENAIDDSHTCGLGKPGTPSFGTLSAAQSHLSKARKGLSPKLQDYDAAIAEAQAGFDVLELHIPDCPVMFDPFGELGIEPSM